ncbi:MULTISPECIES: group 1 truncated hemoglobin [unclassified Herbaspirillum]|uniref:group I truncated hemoglobin n=1 Tax=unclassified Herbaspirillum TaxID=2624150 RepID=UPI000C0BA19F|nr:MULTISPECIES: group 1 truncated hemoglobin [unclassified Herbaspirillum]MAF03699.1 group 1 truncated hemoglobin [Herbaspirillum sp.]MBO16901.1 group 1 truncated hemoglobin [Herbaspirillum sp.]|tara:strand:- start:1001 stop:1447 length:447 start_codon:yes stop_codon:yes gene_type:complete
MNKFRMQQAALGLTLACALGLAQAQAPATPDDSLFRALGGLPVIERVVQDFMDNMLADARIRHTFDNSNVKRVREKLVEQFCQLSGGGCIYTGDPMREVHQGLKLSNADFNALVEDLQLAMDKNGIPSRTQNRLLALLAPMQRETVSR